MAKQVDKEISKLKAHSEACYALFEGLVAGTVSRDVVDQATKMLGQQTRYQAERLKYRQARGERPELEELE